MGMHARTRPHVLLRLKLGGVQGKGCSTCESRQSWHCCCAWGSQPGPRRSAQGITSFRRGDRACCARWQRWTVVLGLQKEGPAAATCRGHHRKMSVYACRHVPANVVLIQDTSFRLVKPALSPPATPDVWCITSRLASVDVSTSSVIYIR
jgi:hypothetical protein